MVTLPGAVTVPFTETVSRTVPSVCAELDTVTPLGAVMLPTAACTTSPPRMATTSVVTLPGFAAPVVPGNV